MHSITAETAIAINAPNCDQVIPCLPLITDARIYEQKIVGHRFFVELVSQSFELQDSYPVPKQVEIVDLVVIEPTESALRSLISACGWLQGYKIAEFWQSSDCTEF